MLAPCAFSVPAPICCSSRVACRSPVIVMHTRATVLVVASLPFRHCLYPLMPRLFRTSLLPKRPSYRVLLMRNRTRWTTRKGYYYIALSIRMMQSQRDNPSTFARLLLHRLLLLSNPIRWNVQPSITRTPLGTKNRQGSNHVSHSPDIYLWKICVDSSCKNRRDILAVMLSFATTRISFPTR
ncbi:hypothetical protein CPC08DRAFT_73106 [Agrocybe pediades]|nr:hypothetical protein CPC08DRAFT_73106 [Agrocybe pediades]